MFWLLCRKAYSLSITDTIENCVRYKHVILFAAAQPSWQVDDSWKRKRLLCELNFSLKADHGPALGNLIMVCSLAMVFFHKLCVRWKLPSKTNVPNEQLWELLMLWASYCHCFQWDYSNYYSSIQKPAIVFRTVVDTLPTSRGMWSDVKEDITEKCTVYQYYHCRTTKEMTFVQQTNNNLTIEQQGVSLINK